MGRWKSAGQIEWETMSWSAGTTHNACSAPPDIVATVASRLWAGWDWNVAFWVDGVWMRLVPRPGWLARIADEATFVVWNGSDWEPVGVPQDISDAIFSLVNAVDPTKRALFSLSGISTGTTRNFTLPNTSSELAILAGTQTFSGKKTFSGTLTASGAVSITGTLTASGTVTVSAAAASIGTAVTAATYGMGTGVNSTGVTKTLNLGTGGASGSTTVVNIGSATIWSRGHDGRQHADSDLRQCCLCGGNAAGQSDGPAAGPWRGYRRQLQPSGDEHTSCPLEQRRRGDRGDGEQGGGWQ